MVQIGKDYYEDLTTETFAAILDDLAAGKVPTPGPQNGRYAAEPLSGLTSLKDHEAGKHKLNASAQLADDIGDTIKRIDGTEVPLLTPWQGGAASSAKVPAETPRPKSAVQQAEAKADDLTKIKGVGPKAAEAIAEAGITSFAQIAGWSDEDVAWADENIKGAKGKASRDDWRAQAKALSEG